MTYDQAEKILRGDEPDDRMLPPPLPRTAGHPINRSLIPYLRQDLEALTLLARKLRKERASGGGIDLSSGDRDSELKFVLDENGIPCKVVAKKELEIHHTIAELMIMTNACVANRIYKRYPDSALLRVHKAIEDDKVKELERLFKAGGIPFDGRSNRALADSLKNSNRSATMESLFQSLVTRAMSEAKYIRAGSQEKGTGLSHYGLGLMEQYTHFTSPIRRYADVIVHRQLLASLDEQAKRVKTHGMKHWELDLSIPDSQAMSVLSLRHELQPRL